MSKIYKATHRGALNIGGTDIACAVLEDGRRIVSATALFKAFDRPRKGERRLENLPSVIGAKNLLPFINDEVYKKSEIINYYHTNGRIAEGYTAELIPIIADLYMEAYEQNVLIQSQEKVYIRAKVIIRALAKVGITALIDEATGYQYDRQAQELQELLKAYISEDLLKWQKRFPNKFYSEIFRLHGWKYDPESSKRPGYVGTFTKKYVYDLFPTEVLTEIEKKNPNKTGTRKKRHHQFLTTDIGIPQLDHYISKLLGVMSLCEDKKDFERNFQRAFKEEIEIKSTEASNNEIQQKLKY